MLLGVGLLDLLKKKKNHNTQQPIVYIEKKFHEPTIKLNYTIVATVFL